MDSNKITPQEISDMLFPINRKIKNINNGGCGIFAVALHKELLRHGITSRIVAFEDEAVFHWTRKEYRNSVIPKLRRARLAKRQPDRGAHAHYMVKIGKYAIDSRGCFEIQSNAIGKYITYPPAWCTLDALGTIGVEDMEYLTRFKWAWNDAFRRTSKGSIKKLIQQQLSKILK